MFSTSFHLFASASLSIPSGRAGVATAVGNGGGFGGRPVWGIKLCVARGSMVSCGFEYWQASDVGSTANKSKQIGQDNVTQQDTQTQPIMQLILSACMKYLVNLLL